MEEKEERIAVLETKLDMHIQHNDGRHKRHEDRLAEKATKTEVNDIRLDLEETNHEVKRLGDEQHTAKVAAATTVTFAGSLGAMVSLLWDWIKSHWVW